MASIDWATAVTALGTLAAAACAVVALRQSSKQIELSNKQNLFNRRLDLLQSASTMVQLCSGVYKSVGEVKGGEVFFHGSFMFRGLANCAELHEISSVIEHPGEQPTHSHFLCSLEFMRKKAMTAELVFSDPVGLRLKVFFNSFAEALFALYQYEIMLNHMKEGSWEFGLTVEEASERFGEPAIRGELLGRLDDLRRAWKCIEDEGILDKASGQIGLLT